MATPRRPSSFDRMFNTPPITPSKTDTTTKLQPLGDLTNIRAVTLTPPTSPRQSLSSHGPIGLGLVGIDGRLLQNSGRDGSMSISPADAEFSQPPSSTVLECPFEVEILKDHNGREQIYGVGAWSTVLKGVGCNRPDSSSNFLTPPTSPIASVPQLVAVKKPARRDAIQILRSEALILSHLATTDGCEFYVVPFYGILPTSNSLILAAMPLSLDNHIRRCAIEAQATQTTWTMSEPVLGSTRIWLSLASRMIEALAWLHTDAGVVHGDVKPGNILLSATRNSNSEFPFDPLFADFSSGQLLNSVEPTSGTLSAVTREYTAPELLNYAVLKDPSSTATTASDVFSLAVTLLVAATGELFVYPGIMLQRQAMASQGWYVLSNVRNGDQGARVSRHGIVDQVLERAVLKAGMGRIDALSWVKLVEGKMAGEPCKKL